MQTHAEPIRSHAAGGSLCPDSVLAELSRHMDATLRVGELESTAALLRHKIAALTRELDASRVVAADLQVQLRQGERTLQSARAGLCSGPIDFAASVPRDAYSNSRDSGKGEGSSNGGEASDGGVRIVRGGSLGSERDSLAPSPLTLAAALSDAEAQAAGLSQALAVSEAALAVSGGRLAVSETALAGAQAQVRAGKGFGFGFRVRVRDVG